MAGGDALGSPSRPDWGLSGVVGGGGSRPSATVAAALATPSHARRRRRKRSCTSFGGPTTSSHLPRVVWVRLSGGPLGCEENNTVDDWGIV